MSLMKLILPSVVDQLGVWRSESLAAAEEILLSGLKAFPDESCIHNLGCYACVAGRLDAAKDRLIRAMELAPTLQKSALLDADLTSIARLAGVRWLRSAWCEHLT
jgi:hypothetical protein